MFVVKQELKGIFFMTLKECKMRIVNLRLILSMHKIFIDIYKNFIRFMNFVVIFLRMIFIIIIHLLPIMQKHLMHILYYNGSSIMVLNHIRFLMEQKLLITVGSGQKVNYRFIDSINFVNASLLSLPKHLVLKGVFPYKFNTQENHSHVGKILAKKYFSPLQMSLKKHEEFKKWWKEKKEK